MTCLPACATGVRTATRRATGAAEPFWGSCFTTGRWTDAEGRRLDSNTQVFVQMGTLTSLVCSQPFGRRGWGWAPGRGGAPASSVARSCTLGISPPPLSTTPAPPHPFLCPQPVLQVIRALCLEGGWFTSPTPAAREKLLVAI